MKSWRRNTVSLSLNNSRYWYANFQLIFYFVCFLLATTYVKVTLLEQGKSIKSRKTRLIRWGSLPNYDDTFVVTLPFDLLSQISFTLTLIARGRLGELRTYKKLDFHLLLIFRTT
jgi:hypothetical protein